MLSFLSAARSRAAHAMQSRATMLMWTHQKHAEGGCSHCPDTGRGAFAKGSRSVAASSSAVCEQVGTTRYTHASAIDQQFKRTHPAGGRRCCAAPPAALKRDAVRIKRDDIVLLLVTSQTTVPTLFHFPHLPTTKNHVNKQMSLYTSRIGN
jgi:hypothetical protein